MEKASYIPAPPKEEVVELIEAFGLVVGRDTWDDNENTLHYLRVEHPSIEHEPLIVYKDDFVLEKLEEVLPFDMNGLRGVLHDHLLELGEERLRAKIKKLLN